MLDLIKSRPWDPCELASVLAWNKHTDYHARMYANIGTLFGIWALVLAYPLVFRPEEMSSAEVARFLASMVAYFMLIFLSWSWCRHVMIFVVEKPWGEFVSLLCWTWIVITLYLNIRYRHYMSFMLAFLVVPTRVFTLRVMATGYHDKLRGPHWRQINERLLAQLRKAGIATGITALAFMAVGTAHFFEFHKPIMSASKSAPPSATTASVGPTEAGAVLFFLATFVGYVLFFLLKHNFELHTSLLTEIDDARAVDDPSRRPTPPPGGMERLSHPD